MKAQKAKTEGEKESSSAFFQNLRPKFLDWKPPTEEEKALEVKARREAREARVEKGHRTGQGQRGHKKALIPRSTQICFD